MHASIKTAIVQGSAFIVGSWCMFLLGTATEPRCWHSRKSLRLYEALFGEITNNMHYSQDDG